MGNKNLTMLKNNLFINHPLRVFNTNINFLVICQTKARFKFPVPCLSFYLRVCFCSVFHYYGIMPKTIDTQNARQLTSKRTNIALLASVFITIALYYIPYGHIIAYPLILLSTLAHEMGHGIAALLVGANFESFSMWTDGSGQALIHGQTSRIGSAIISAGGLVGPSICAGIYFFLGKSTKMARFCLGASGILLIISEIFLVRSFFGVFFVGVVAAVFLYLAIQQKDWLAQTSLVFVAVQLALSVFSRSDYLFTKYVQTPVGLMPSDVAQISEFLFLPHWFWGGLCGIFSLTVLIFGLWVFIKKH